MKKGQIITLDGIIASLIFIAILIAFSLTWMRLVESTELQEIRQDLTFVGSNAVDILLTTEGDPTNWSTMTAVDFNDSMKSIGLSSASDLVLSTEKLSTLENLNESHYTDYKRLLGLLGPGYEFELQVLDWNGASFLKKYEIGVNPPVGTGNVIAFTRYALLNQSRAKINFKVWKE